MPNDDLLNDLRGASRGPNDLPARAARALEAQATLIDELRVAGRRIVGANAMRVLAQQRSPHVGNGVREARRPRRREDGLE
jgi:hypothetical protein